MRSLVWTGAVAIIVMASGTVVGQKRSRPVPAGMMTSILEQARSRTASSPTAVVDRIMSFDANGDDRIGPDELPERMEGLVSRGDKNQDGFLTSDEVVVLIDTQPTMPRPPTSIVRRKEGSIADIIADLKLPASTHNRALAIVNGPRNVYEPSSVDLYAEMRELLDDGDYENFVAAITRLRRAPRIIGGIAGGVAGNTPSPLR